jgi:hypothetical protein
LQTLLDSLVSPTEPIFAHSSREEIKGDNENGRVSEITCISVTRLATGEGKIDCEITERRAFYFRRSRMTVEFISCAALSLPRDKLFEILWREREKPISRESQRGGGWNLSRPRIEMRDIDVNDEEGVSRVKHATRTGTRPSERKTSASATERKLGSGKPHAPA